MNLAVSAPLPILNGRGVSAPRTSPAMTVFLVCLTLPFVLELGSLRLSPYRIVLLVMFVPCVIGWISGAMGRFRLPDGLILALAAWCSLSFLVRHGFTNGIEAAGIVFIETLTPYLIARLWIRDLATFVSMVRTLICLLCVMLPFALVETVTGWNVLLDGLGRVLPTFADVPKPTRLGLDRVQGPFEHPILFGVFFGPALALGYYALSMRHRLVRSMFVFSTTALSLSSGPLTALIAQAGMIAWDRVFANYAGRWAFMCILIFAGYVTVDLLSNRTPAEVFISYAAFNSETAYNRLLIWEWGWVNIWQNPVFGIGKDDWQRLWHMTSSFDMFWLHRALVHGLPAGVLNLGLLLGVVLGLLRLRHLSAQMAKCRTGLIIALAGFLVAGMTVHFWNATFVWLMFLLGSGAWLHDAQDTQDGAEVPSVIGGAVAPMPRGLLEAR